MTYRILDEPKPHASQRLAVAPFWPLLATMFAGAGPAWLWFLINAHALGSPTRRREAAWAVIGLLGNAAILFSFVGILEAGWLPRASGPYVGVVLTAWKLGVSYKLFNLQNATFHLYEYFGGTLQNGLPGLLVSYFLSRGIRSLGSVSTFLFV